MKFKAILSSQNGLYNLKILILCLVRSLLALSVGEESLLLGERAMAEAVGWVGGIALSTPGTGTMGRK
jgi:hypothetical protein